MTSIKEKLEQSDKIIAEMNDSTEFDEKMMRLSKEFNRHIELQNRIRIEFATYVLFGLIGMIVLVFLVRFW